MVGVQKITHGTNHFPEFWRSILFLTDHNFLHITAQKQTFFANSEAPPSHKYQITVPLLSWAANKRKSGTGRLHFYLSRLQLHYISANLFLTMLLYFTLTMKKYRFFNHPPPQEGREVAQR